MPVLAFSALAKQQYEHLRNDPALDRKHKVVQKALGFLERDPKHKSLNTHEWKGKLCPHGDKIFEAYAENKTPGAYRIFFCYPPDQRGKILILAMTPHSPKGSWWNPI